MLLKTFHKGDIIKLGEFLHSPYHNKHKYIVRLFEQLSGYYPEFKEEDMNSERIFSQLYPGKKYNYSRMRNLTSDLLALTEQFISIENFTKDKFSSALYLLETLPEKQLDNLFEKKYKASESICELTNPLNEVGYLNRYRLLQTRSIFVNRRKSNDAKENAECYQGIVNESIKFFLAALFKNYFLMLNKNITFFKYDYDTKFIKIIMGYMENNLPEFENDTCILLYYYFTVFYLKYDEESYIKLEAYTKNNFEKIDKQDALNAVINLVNYCRRQALAGEHYYEKKALSLFKLALEKNMWNDVSKIRPSVFRGITATSCNCGEFEWCNWFIGKYKFIQPKEHIESNANLCYGRMYFDMGEYSKALSFLAKVVHIDSTYKYEADTLIIRIFYETGETEAYISKVDSFKKWVNNNKTVISDRYRKMFKEMADYFSLLIKLKLVPDEYAIKKMKQEITDNKKLVNRQWLLKKISELNFT